MRTVLPPLAAAVAVGVVALSEGQGSDRAAGGGGYVSAAGQPTVSSMAVQAQADQVFESFHGTVRQREAGAVLQAWALNNAMDSCMEDAGTPGWDWSATRNGAPRTNAPATSKFFAKPLAAAYSSALIDVAETLVAEHELREKVLTEAEAEAEAEAEDAAVGVCLTGTPPTSDEDASAPSTPAARLAWREVVRRAAALGFHGQAGSLDRAEPSAPAPDRA